ncbi:MULTISPECIES: sulfur carrier protein ThiS [Rhodanobacter]|uniref:sulfur carrier protein ThiS n=1 Tax=Rhodanobacter TaxID=75309 RepID=UPI00041D59D6|nr:MULTISPECIES: sulfur carrier protein ThiS [Rhodanobacter]TAN18947.1 MAG: sulfur carrier protein ThiS [Rhodanobacter sp.]UJJ55533.1 sulfur carrier protein ThiS [Rhodanobacter thiooxydans]
MNILVNGEPQPPAEHLQALLARMGLAEAAVATAVNGRFVAAAQRAGTQLAAGDRVEVLAPMQGG